MESHGLLACRSCYCCCSFCSCCSCCCSSRTAAVADTTAPADATTVDVPGAAICLPATVAVNVPTVGYCCCFCFSCSFSCYLRRCCSCFLPLWLYLVLQLLAAGVAANVSNTPATLVVLVQLLVLLGMGLLALSRTLGWYVVRLLAGIRVNLFSDYPQVSANIYSKSVLSD